MKIPGNKNYDIVRISFLRLLPVQIFGIVISAINSFANTLITSRFLDPDAMAAIGLFGPVTTILGVAYVLINGLQILCGNSIGSGDGKKSFPCFLPVSLYLPVSAF